ncbi:MAG: UDP-2,3-diacylglucosamine diphosphatase LpxI [Alphaproteobacteria bacterium]|nr:UDP-2,3-diacylglucosamine diphosphatase LpxI [Alphaproteobacteria bacterium]
MKNVSDKKIALFAGALRLPFLVRDSLRASGWEVFVVGLRGFYEPELMPDMVVRLGGGGAAARECKRRGIKLLTFVGAIGHPDLSDVRPDLWSLSVFMKVLKNQKGYDSMARAVISGIESKGFKIVGAQDLCPDLTFAPGVQTKTRPTTADKKVIDRAIQVSKVIGAEDIGASVVVDRQVLAIEAAEGTANMLRRVVEIRKNRRGKKASGVFAKMIKPKQDLRIDTTAIGVDTVRDVAAAGLRGIVVDAKECFVIDRAAVISAADKAKIFIVAVGA